MIYWKNFFIGKEAYFYIFGSGDCDYAMGDVSNQDNAIEEVTPKCMDVITEQKKKNSKRGRSDTVKINKIIVEFHCCLLHWYNSYRKVEMLQNEIEAP